ncbi:MAG TPA: phosphate ABC transporter substrate-binding protein, PhoT family [Ignavibacteriales bacterium]|nr:phosphate ABC transporter substrate-binding protein, PhoT family [Ignavibacteriales bacterium]
MTKMKIRYKILILFFQLLAFISCTNQDSPTDTPTTGELTISVDETYMPLVDSEITTFESIYNYAKVSVRFKTETDAFNDLMSDSVRLIIVPRKLNSEELKQFEKWEIVPKITKIAYDAIALIGSKDIKDTVYTIAKIKSLINNEIGNKSLKKTKIVFDNNNSSTIRFIKEKTGVTNFSTNCYALNSNKAVLDYVAKEKDCIGIIGVNWISDHDDTTNLSFLKNVKVLEIASDEKSEPLKPYQAYIAQKTYPLYREIYIISKEAYTGLGTGFTAFVASERGQRIVLKFGLVPATMPVRLVELINEDITN